MTHILEDLKKFLDNSPTSYHAVQEMADRLVLCDFLPLEEKDPWHLEKGKRYFVIRGGSLCCFVIPNAMPDRMLILGSHTDSPSLKLKPRPEHPQKNMRFLGVEIYGSPHITSWLNRDLAIAGRILIQDEHNAISSRLVWLDDAPLIIPQLAIHLEKHTQEKGIQIDLQEHLVPLSGLIQENDSINSYLEMQLRRHISFKSLLGFDLFLVPLETSRFLGAKGELLAAHRIDNLSSVHACLTAMGKLQSSPSNSLSIAAFFDHEEIGSHTAEGASSAFLKDILKRIRLSLKMEKEHYLRMKTQSLIVSIDVAHGFHPGFDKKYDKEHAPLLGKGVVVKFNAAHKYGTSGTSAALIEKAFLSSSLPKQIYASRNDVGCGSTIGPILETSLGIPTVDIGIPILSMHSTREIASTQDHIDMCSLLEHLLTTGL